MRPAAPARARKPGDPHPETGIYAATTLLAAALIFAPVAIALPSHSPQQHKCGPGAISSITGSRLDPAILSAQETGPTLPRPIPSPTPSPTPPAPPTTPPTKPQDPTAPTVAPNSTVPPVDHPAPPVHPATPDQPSSRSPHSSEKPPTPATPVTPGIPVTQPPAPPAG